MSKYKKLFKNSLTFTIGSFGSKLINIIMVPIYTHLLSTSEFGTVDIINTTVNLLIPVTTLELGQAALRFAIDGKDKVDENKIFSNISLHTLLITLILSLIVPIVIKLNLFDNLSVLFVILLLLSTYNNLLSQYIRGIGKVREFAMNGILTTLVTVLSNLILLVYFDFKIIGYIFSTIIALCFSNLYLFYKSDGIKQLKNINTDFKLLRNMLKFSIPIIPNSAMWWVINGSTRYFILYFIGANGNGLFAVANKLPSVISMVTGIFSQAWQLSSFEEYESDDRETFYSTIFNIYWVVLFSIGSVILIIVKPLLKIIVEESFYLSWQVVPLLILAVLYQSFSTFLGTNYTAARETKGTFLTSIYGGIISLISSFIFVPILGVIGAGIGTLLSFVGMFVIRLIDTKKFIIISINKCCFLITNILYLLQTAALFMLDGLSLIFLEIILFSLIFIINRKVLLMLSKQLIVMLKQILSGNRNK